MENQEIKFLGTLIYSWVTDTFLTVPFLLNFALILGLLWLSRKLSKRILATLFNKPEITHQQELASFYDITYGELAFLITGVLTLWTTYFGFQLFQQETVFIEFAAQALTSWFMVRLVSGFMNSIFLKIISIIIWLVLLMYFLDILPLAADILNTYWINLGTTKISVKKLFTGIILFAIILWAVDILAHYLSKRVKQSTKIGMSQKILYSKAITFCLFAITLLWGLKYLGLDITTLAVFGGGLGVGIGLGLQMLFSNIVSGIAILLDRSVRPGDVISLNGTYGTVTRLEARYVSVVTRDGKKHLIPNNDLISKPIESWSYRDEIVRVEVPVSVSFKSDVHLVKEILLKVAHAHPRVLQNPEPVCLMMSYGDFAINFELRFWIEDPINGIGRPKSDILFGIWDEFKKHNIIIPYPQQDVHLCPTPDPTKTL